MFEILDKCIVWLDDFGLLYNFNIVFPKARYKIKTSDENTIRVVEKLILFYFFIKINV
ncbi:hypothetical protein LEP1GSC059_3982 [Leptospira noguchii serovar Panama str. CZ214]|uniref:Uncharacterized protein n=1 Tax=Leptospira noguchii serovar Panama str. CZ214 TaxID=1001595 RepID=T0FKH3_9LEPT|nr:hypothetical protein LEP1GSC059_3982 [Leptospira noguchii serovar Panama str. CZ214]